MEPGQEISSHFAFGEHWNELPEYVGYVPAEYLNWQILKATFYASERYDQDNPLPVNIKKGNTTIVVNLYGFKVPEVTTVIAFGTDSAIKGRVALCKIVTTKQYVAIAW